MFVPSVSPQADPSPLIQTVAGRQYGRWAVQFRRANVAAAARRDVALARSRSRLEDLQRLRDAGVLDEGEYARLAALV